MKFIWLGQGTMKSLHPSSRALTASFDPAGRSLDQPWQRRSEAIPAASDGCNSRSVSDPALGRRQDSFSGGRWGLIRGKPGDWLGANPRRACAGAYWAHRNAVLFRSSSECLPTVSANVRCFLNLLIADGVGGSHFSIELTLPCNMRAKMGLGGCPGLLVGSQFLLVAATFVRVSVSVSPSLVWYHIYEQVSNPESPDCVLTFRELGREGFKQTEGILGGRSRRNSAVYENV